MKIRRASLTTTRVITLFAASAIGIASIIAGCNRKEEVSSTSKDSTAATTTTAGVDSTASAHTSADTTSAVPAAITGKAADGQKIFYDQHYGKIKVACSSCHTDGQPTTKDDHIRPGHTLVGVTSRTSTWNGAYKGADLPKLAYGASQCAVMYLRKGDNVANVLPAGDVEALNAYFDAIKNSAGAIAKDLAIQWVTKPAIHENDDINLKAATAAAKTILKVPGDPGSGEKLFKRSCANCHSLTEKKAGPALNDAVKDPQQATMAIRVGSDAMPFYAKDVLSDQQVSDIMAYVLQALNK